MKRKDSQLVNVAQTIARFIIIIIIIIIIVARLDRRSFARYAKEQTESGIHRNGQNAARVN